MYIYYMIFEEQQHTFHFEIFTIDFDYSYDTSLTPSDLLDLNVGNGVRGFFVLFLLGFDEIVSYNSDYS
jgi:hypothetical protein